MRVDECTQTDAHMPRFLLTEKIRPAYQSLIAKMATLIGGEANYVDLVDAVVSLDSFLLAKKPEAEEVAVPWTRIISVLPSTTYQMWLQPFAKYYADGKTIHSTNTVHIHSPRYFQVGQQLKFYPFSYRIGM